MEITKLLFSLVFFLISCFYLYLGVYVIRINPKAVPNRLFLCLASSLCLWSLGFSFASFAGNPETALLWRRFSALGWTTFYGFLLHFVLSMNGRKITSRPALFYSLLYIPAVINIYAFAISGSMAEVQYNLVKTRFGWNNISVNNGWDWFFYAYYLTYFIASLVMLWKNNKTESSGTAKKGYMLIFYTMLVSLILGTFTDVILVKMFSDPIPQMAPVFILISMSAIAYSMKRFSFLPDAAVNESEIILNEQTAKDLYFYLSAVFLAGSVLSFLSYYFSCMTEGPENLTAALNTSGMLFLFALTLQLFKLIRNENIRHIMLVSLMLFSIPAVTLMFIRYASITVWVLPLILMMATLLFNSRVSMILIAIVSIITQVIVWIYSPKGYVKMDEFDFVIRIGVFLISLVIGLFINKIYVSKLKENSYQIEFQRMVSEISYDFMNINRVNFESRISSLLERTGNFFKASRTYIFLVDSEDKTLNFSEEWCSDGIQSRKYLMENLSMDDYAWWFEQLRGGNAFFLKDITQLPAEAAAEKSMLTKLDVKSVISIPIMLETEILGFIEIDSPEISDSYTDVHIAPLDMLANIIANGLIKIKNEEQIEYMAYYDHLTGLPNRTLFNERLRQSLFLSQRTGKLTGVMFIDLDGFKILNDTLGHGTGDVLLQEVSKKLLAASRKSDTVARFGGDEFLILFNNMPDKEHIQLAAERIISLFKEPFNIQGQDIFTSCSAGVAIYPLDGDDPEMLIKNADSAMYRAKETGKNQYSLCSDDMKKKLIHEMMLSNNLHRAHELDEFELYYQPQLNMNTGNITGLEALIRWKHPSLGMISPAVFIPLAEKNGTIHSIGEWVLRTACLQNLKWQHMGLPRIRMAVNVSASQFKNPNLVENVKRTITETGLDPRYLELEITESIAINEKTYITDILSDLKESGISISIDDFGTQYSSLNRLKELPVDRIKIDRQFLSHLEINEKDQAITRVIINLAQNLGLEVLAEGVETQIQADFLLENGCPEVQGFLYFRPMPAEDIENILRASLQEF